MRPCFKALSMDPGDVVNLQVRGLDEEALGEFRRWLMPGGDQAEDL